MGSRKQQQKTSKTHSSLSFKITLNSWDRDKKMDFHREARISLPEDLLEPKYFNILVWEQKRNPISLEHWRNVAHNSKREGKSITWKLIYLLSNIFCMFEPATIKKKPTQSGWLFLSMLSFRSHLKLRKKEESRLHPRAVSSDGTHISPCILECPSPQNSSKRQQQCTSREEFFQENKTHNISSTKENK